MQKNCWNLPPRCKVQNPLNGLKSPFISIHINYIVMLWRFKRLFRNIQITKMLWFVCGGQVFTEWQKLLSTGFLPAPEFCKHICIWAHFANFVNYIIFLQFNPIYWSCLLCLSCYSCALCRYLSSLETGWYCNTVLDTVYCLQHRITITIFVVMLSNLRYRCNIAGYNKIVSKLLRIELFYITYIPTYQMLWIPGTFLELLFISRT